MRATFDPQLIIQNDYVITGDKSHHLMNVVRVEVGEDLLLINGQGLKVETEIVSVSKKSLNLKYKNHSQIERAFQYDLALGMPKREALELCLKQATELGFRKIYLVKSKYSQMRFPEASRTQNLLISAVEQANNLYLPEVVEVEWSELPWDDYGTALWLDSQKNERKIPQTKLNSTALLIVGPEGGFSPEEMKFFRGKTMIESLCLPTPILRTTTAVATGAGILLERLMK